MKKDLIKKKTEGMGLQVKKINFLNKGTSRDSYLIYCKEGKFVLKLFKKKKEKEVQQQMNLMRKINYKEQLTIFPIHKKILDFATKVGYIYQFVEGIPYSQARIKHKLYSFGKLIGHFNKATKDILPNNKDSAKIFRELKKAKKRLIHITQRDSLHQKAKKLIKEGIALVDTEYKKTPLRTQLIHGDLHQDNVYYRNKQTTILDMDGLQNSILIEEIATYASYLSRKSMERYEQEMQTFIKGYETERPLTKKEKETLPLLLIDRKIGEISYILKQEHEKKLPKKQVTYFLRHITRKLTFLIKHYSEIKKIFKKL